MQWRGNTHIVLAVSIIMAVGLIFVLIYFDAMFLKQDRLSTTDREITNRIEDVNVEYAKYVVWTLKFRESTFEWSLRSTKIIFWVSMLISVSGIMFAFWQFLDASNKDQRAVEADELEIKTQMASIAFKSRSLASLVLFVSIAYLLIYVRFVHPINETHDKLGTNEAAQAVVTGATQSPPATDNQQMPSEDDPMPVAATPAGGTFTDQPSQPMNTVPEGLPNPPKEKVEDLTNN